MCFCTDCKLWNTAIYCAIILWKIWSLDFPAIAIHRLWFPFSTQCKKFSFSCGTTYFTSSINRHVIHVILFLKTPSLKRPGPGARFSKAPETFRARKAIFNQSVSKNSEVYTPQTSCMKRASVHINNMWIKQLCNHKVRDFETAFRVRKLFGSFEKRAPVKT